VPYRSKNKSMELITLKTFDSSIDAHLTKSKLESEEIKCFLFDENIVGLNPLYNIAVNGIKLKINKFDFDKASKVIQEFDNSLLTQDNGEAIICPNCKSDKVYSGFKSMKGTKGFFSAILSFIFLVFPIYFETKYRCKSCNKEFN